MSQKDHLSCVRGSIEREGDSDEGWLLLSSPFKLFLHTGHVSCCVAAEQKADISSGHFSHIPYFSTNLHDAQAVLWLGVAQIATDMPSQIYVPKASP